MEDSHLLHMIKTPITPLPTPEELNKQHPLTAADQVIKTRTAVIDCLEGRDKRLIVMVGPCSEDDSLQPDGTPSVVAFAKEIKALSERPEINQQLLLLMRCPPTKPRTDLGLAGLEQKDVVVAHKLLTDIANLGVPLASEVMEPEHLARYGHLLSLVWVGARNNKVTKLRQALSAFGDLPILCKNGEQGELDPALQAITTINESHENASITMPNGDTAYVAKTTGNPHTGIIWRGGEQYLTPQGFEAGLQNTAATSMPYAVDCAHGNERAHDPQQKKSIAGQKACFDHLIELISSKKLEANPKAIMIESYLLEGMDTTQQTPGQSWTDPCIGLEDTKAMIQHLAEVHATLD